MRKGLYTRGNFEGGTLADKMCELNNYTKRMIEEIAKNEDFDDETYSAKYFHNTRRYVPNGRSKELDSELEAEVDAGAFAGNDPNIDTDGMYYNKSTGDYIKPVEYDKRKIGHTDKYNPGRVVQKPEETDYKIYDDPDEITDKPDPEYDEYLKSQKTYHDPAPGLADIDPDDPNIEWFD